MYGFKPGSKPKDKDKGGKIEGPGTGTSDSIKTEIPKGSYIMPADSTQQVGPKALDDLGEPVPVNVSNGEYQMPPEQVHAVGDQALNQMRDATHMPAPAGFTPQNDGLYFADGGSPAEEERRRLPGNPLAVTYGDMTGRPSAGMAPQPRQAAVMPAVSYNDMQRAPSRPQPSAPSPAGAINTATPPRPSAPAAGQPPAQEAGFGAATERAPQGAPVSFSSVQREPNVPRTGQPRQMPQGEPIGTSGVVGGLQAAGQRAAAGVQSAADQVAQAGRGFVAGGQAMTDQAATASGSAVDAASGALNYLNRGDPVRDAIGAVGGVFSRSAQQARQADYGAGAPSPAAPAPEQSTPPPVAQPAPAATTPAADQPASPGATPPAPAARTGYGFTPDPMQGPAPGMSVRPTSAEGINRIDNAPGLKSPLFTNLPTGEAISGMQGGTVNTMPAFRAPAQAAGAAQGFGQEREGPAGGVIGSGRPERDRYGDLMSEVAKLSQGGRAGRNRAAAMIGAYAAAQRGEEADMRDQAGTRELGFRQEDAAARNAQSARELQERSADRTGRLALDERRLAGEEQVRGFEARGMERAEKLYAAYESAKTPEERAAVAEQLRALSGKEAPNRFTVVPGGQEIDPTTNMAVTRPARVFNNQSGQFVDQPGGQAAPAAPRPGEVRGGYRFKGGNPADQASWEKV